MDTYENCYYGKVPNDIVMTSNMKDDQTVQKYKNLLLQLSDWFGPQKPYESEFEIFSSRGYEHTERKNIMFNDATKALVAIGADRDRYYTWVGKYEN